MIWKHREQKKKKNAISVAKVFAVHVIAIGSWMCLFGDLFLFFVALVAEAAKQNTCVM